MHLTLGSEQFGRLTCEITNGAEKGIATASHLPEAAAALLAAVRSMETGVTGECFWQEGAGEYRWAFRRNGDRARVAVLWCSGAMTGWEHVFWAECPVSELVQQVSEQVAGL